MTISSLIEGGFRLIKERPGAMLIWAIIYIALTIGTSLWMASVVQALFDAMLSGESLQVAQSSLLVQTLLVSVATAVVSTVLYAAVQRAILRPAEGGPGWLKFGMDEIRYLLILLLFSIIFGIGLVILGVFLGLFFMGGGGPAGVQIVQILTIVICFVVFSYFGTKLSLVFPLTMKEDTFAIGAGWRLSDGRFWTLYGAYFIIVAVMFVVGIATTMVTEPEYLSAIFQHGFGSPEADEASLLQFQKIASGTIDAPIIIGWVLAGLQGAIGAVFLGGAAATAVQQLTADEAGLSDTFS